VHSLATGSAPASKKNCSKTSISYHRPSPQRCLRSIHEHPRTMFFRRSIRRKKCGTTSNRCPKAGRTIARLSRSSSRNSPAASMVNDVKKTSRLEIPATECSPPLQHRPQKTQRRTDFEHLPPNNSPTIFSKKSSVSRRSMAEIRRVQGSVR